jgi:hypothetical protein
VPRAQAQSFRETIFVCLVVLVSADELQRSLNDRLLAPPGWRQRSAFGAASQTRSISRHFRGGGVGKKLDVLALWLRRTDRPAVDTGGFDGNEKFTVEARISRAHGFVKFVHLKSVLD